MALPTSSQASADPEAARAVSVGRPSELLAAPARRSPSRSASSRADGEIGSHRDLFPRFSSRGGRLQSLHVVRSSTAEAASSPSAEYLLPIFEGGRIRANISLQTRAAGVTAAYSAVVLQAFQDVEDALVGFSHEQATGTARETRCGERAAADLARRAYRQGLTDFLTAWSPSNRCSPRRTHSRRASATSRSSWLRSTSRAGGWEASTTSQASPATGSPDAADARSVVGGAALMLGTGPRVARARRRVPRRAPRQRGAPSGRVPAAATQAAVPATIADSREDCPGQRLFFERRRPPCSVSCSMPRSRARIHRRQTTSTHHGASASACANRS